MQSQTIRRVLRLAALAIFTLVGASAFAGTTTIYNIDQKTGWQSCSACAGKGGNGPVATYSSKQGVSSPSMDGNSMQFNLGGSTPYANALWWKQLGGNSSAYNFTYDLYYYLKNPTAAQALEFDVNQSVGGHKLIFGTECNIMGGHVWDVYDPYNHVWRQTSVPCNTPTAYKWNHVVLEFHRGTSAKTEFVSVTINGSKHYFNRSYTPKSSSVSEINVAFQMDGNKSQTDYSVWLDKVKLTYW